MYNKQKANSDLTKEKSSILGAIAPIPLVVIAPQSYVTVTNSLPLLLQSLHLLPYLSLCQGHFATMAKNVRIAQISPWVL